MYLHIIKIWKRVLFIELAICLSTVHGQDANVNLPSKILVPENTKTGTVVFTIEPASFLLANAYPEITSNAFSYNKETGEIVVYDDSILDYEGYHKTFVMRFEEEVVEGKRKKRAAGEDLVLLFELQNVLEPSDSSGCCSDVSTIKWLVPVCASIELLAMILCSTILLFCFIKKNNRTSTVVQELR